MATPSKDVSTALSLSGSVLSGEGLHSLHKVQGQAVLGVVLWQDFNQTADQPAGLGQWDQGAPQLTGVLQHTKHIVLHYIVKQAARVGLSLQNRIASN